MSLNNETGPSPGAVGVLVCVRDIAEDLHGHSARLCLASDSRFRSCSMIGQHHVTWTRRTEEMMPKGKLSPEGEVIAAYGAAMVAAFQVLINCLEENDAVLPGQFPDALGVYMEMVKSRKGDVSD